VQSLVGADSEQTVVNQQSVSDQSVGTGHYVPGRMTTYVWGRVLVYGAGTGL